MNRQKALRTILAGGAAGAASATFVVAAVPAAAVHDPLKEAILAYIAERDAAFAMPMTAKDEAFDEAFDRRVMPLFWAINGLVPTTMAGALLAIRFLEEETESGPSALAASPISGVATFLKGNAS